jgi:hypothetical protein
MKPINFYLAILILLILTFVAACDKTLGKGKDTNNLFSDSTSVAFEDALKKIAADSNLQNFNNCIKYAHTDSIKLVFEKKRRKMYTSFTSFNKLKVNPEEVVKINPCYAPLIMKIDRIHDKNYSWKDLLNEKFSASDYKARRFVIGDFNTTDEKGNCKGCLEEFPDIWNLTELKSFLNACRAKKVDLQDNASISQFMSSLSQKERLAYKKMQLLWLNLRDHVEAYRTEPLKKEPIIEVNGISYCIGQRLCLCEIQNDTIVKVAQFVTSSKNAAAPQSNQRDFDGQRRYYGVMNRLTTRYWDYQIKYDTLDKMRDTEMGFASPHVIKYKRRVALPNFMHIIPDDQFPSAKGYVNGIHEFAVGGNVPGKYMGTPISLGCIRLHDYPSKFIRWWTPANAKMFIFYEDKRYKQKP